MKCIHYPAKGSTKGKILFVHGAWHGAWCWEEYFMDYFAKAGYDCFAFNLVGHEVPGKVQGINKLSIGDYVKSLNEAVDEVGEETIIVGHSMGGLVVQKYLEKRACAKAVLMATVPTSGVFRTTLNFLFRKSYSWPSLLSLNLYGLVNSPSKSKWAFFSEGISEELLEKSTAKMNSESFLAFLGMLYPGIKLNHHQKISMLVLGAEDDNIFTVKEQKSTARKYNADLIVLPNIAHDMMLDVNYEQAAKALSDWLLKKK